MGGIVLQVEKTDLFSNLNCISFCSGMAQTTFVVFVGGILLILHIPLFSSLNEYVTRPLSQKTEV
jgi:hypothetical protein